MIRHRMPESDLGLFQEPMLSIPDPELAGKIKIPRICRFENGWACFLG